LNSGAWRRLQYQIADFHFNWELSSASLRNWNDEVVGVTDKGSAIVDIPADESRGLKRSMSGLESKDYDLAVPNPDGGFDTVMI
jgi:hypothetical protein